MCKVLLVMGVFCEVCSRVWWSPKWAANSPPRKVARACAYYYCIVQNQYQDGGFVNFF